MRTPSRSTSQSEGSEGSSLADHSDQHVLSVSRRGRDTEWKRDTVATEFPLTIFVNEEEMATLVCTPSDLEDLVRGFLTAEGVLRREERITRFFIDREEGTAHIEAPDRKGAMEQEMFAKRYVGSCCGKSRTGFYFANDARTAREVEVDFPLTLDDTFELMDGLQAESPLFQKTGGVHNAGLATRDRIQTVRTDIGRHNTLDKLYGHALAESIPLDERMIVFSGRISSEIILKVSKMGCPVLVSQCAPTELALRMAEDLGITTVGFLRGESCNVYTHPQRFTDVSPPSENGSIG